MEEEEPGETPGSWSIREKTREASTPKGAADPDPT
jgi:hypothetical protein